MKNEVDKIQPYPISPWTVEYKSSCPKCGLELSNVMNYFCSSNDCPIGLGGNLVGSFYGKYGNVSIVSVNLI